MLAVSIALVACKKDDSNGDPDPDPTPATDSLTINYYLSSLGADIDTIAYKDNTGAMKYVFGENQFDLTIKQPDDKCDAYFYVRGELPSSFHWADMKFLVTDKNDNVVKLSEKSYDGQTSLFKWEAYYTSSK